MVHDMSFGHFGPFETLHVEGSVAEKKQMFPHKPVMDGNMI
jgi:hypothetical protein